MAGGTFTDDIDDMRTYDGTPANINTANNYSYDEEGRLTKDSQEEIAGIVWRVDGKVKEVNRTGGSTKKNLKFDEACPERNTVQRRDGMGQRIAKHIYTSAGTWEKSTYYVRDAQGNVLAVYNKETVSSSSSYKVMERNLYGSEEIGTYKHEVEMIGAPPLSATDFKHELGHKQYYAKNHLGNVLSTYSDKKKPVDDGDYDADNNGINDVSTPGGAADNIVDYYTADILSSTDYSAFGVVLNNRDFSSAVSRKGFNGMEKYDEMKGAGNSYDFGARLYDNRLGRWLTTDPLAKKYAWISPYAFSENKPISHVDPDGRTATTYIEVVDSKTGRTSLLVVKNYDIDGKNKYVKVTGTFGDRNVFTVTQVEKVTDENKRLAMEFCLYENQSMIEIGKGRPGWPGIVIWGSGGEASGRKAGKILGTFDYGEWEEFLDYIGGAKNAREKKYNPYNKGDYKHDSEEANKKSGERIEDQLEDGKRQEGLGDDERTGTEKMPSEHSEGVAPAQSEDSIIKVSPIYGGRDDGKKSYDKQSGAAHRKGEPVDTKKGGNARHIKTE